MGASSQPFPTHQFLDIHLPTELVPVGLVPSSEDGELNLPAQQVQRRTLLLDKVVRTVLL